MAVAAELVAVEYQLVDDIPEVAAARARVRCEAEDLLERRRNTDVPGPELLPVDALSTADKVLTAVREHGFGSQEHLERKAGLVLDCHRLVGEWYRKLTSEYFEPTRHTFDAASETFFSHGMSIQQMTENAIVPISDNPEQEDRRVNERVEDATPQILRSLGKIAIGNQAVRTISECTDTAIAAYQLDLRLGNKHQGYGGEVPEIEKVMIRDFRLDPETQDRFQEQVALSGEYFTHDVFVETIARRGITAALRTKTELHGAQMLANDDLMDFVRDLDTVASEFWCTQVFMGEEVAPGTVKDYANFREEALRRQESLKELAETVAVFVLDLANDGVDRVKALTMVEDFVKLQLLEIGKHNPEAAEHMFDVQTAQGLRDVRQLEEQGKYAQAFELMQEVERRAPGGGFCGAGSCGLEGVELNSDEGKKLYDKLNAKPGDKIVRDKERACKCGNKSVVYAYNYKKVNKLCESCGAFESKVSVA